MSEQNHNDAALDALLRDAMRSRPEPIASSNLAERVIATARAQDRAAPARQPLAVRIASIVAFIAAGVVVVFGAMKFLAIEAGRTTYQAATSTSSNDVGPLLLFGIGGLAAAIVWLAVQSSIERDDEPLALD